MKNFSKLLKVMVAVLAITLAFGLTGNTASAKKKKKATLYAGEKVKLYTIGIGTLKSVKSSKKSVCSASKDNGIAVVSAKKAGKATITLKGSSGKLTYSVTVKKKPFKVTYSTLKDGSVMLTVSNNSKGYFDGVTVSAMFCDAAGNALNQRNASVSYLGANQKAYVQINPYQNGIDLSKTQVSVIGWSRGIDNKYKGYGKKVKASIIKEGEYYKLNTSTKYKGKGSIYIGVDVAYKDASGNIVKIYNETSSLYSGKKVYTTYGYKMPTGAVSYEVLSKRIYLKSY